MREHAAWNIKSCFYCGFFLLRERAYSVRRDIDVAWNDPCLAVWVRLRVMSVNITTLEIHSRRFPASKNRDELVVRLITRLFGCRHLNMSMPIRCGGETHGHAWVVALVATSTRTTGPCTDHTTSRIDPWVRSELFHSQWHSVKLKWAFVRL